MIEISYRGFQVHESLSDAASTNLDALHTSQFSLLTFIDEFRRDYSANQIL